MAKEEGTVFQLEGIIHAFFREDGSLVIMTRRIDDNVWNASYSEEVELSPEGVLNLRRMLGVVAVEHKMHPTKNGRAKSDKVSKPAVFSG